MKNWPLSTEVGADIESICGKCGDVWHVLVAKVGDKIVKVQCKQCGGLHRYRPPPGSAGAIKQKKTTSRSTSSRARKKKAPEPPPQAPVPRNPSAPPMRYMITEAFEVGDQIKHRTFGVGIVEKLLAPGKMQVYFDGERKVLATAKPAPALERPANLFVEE